MSIISLILLAFSMSADAFAAAIAKGAAVKQPTAKQIIQTALVFGIIETITPMVGWSLGVVAAPYIEAYDHWIAFVLLGGLGAKMIYEGLSDDDDEETETQPKSAKKGLILLMITAFATSIDSMIVGVGLAFLDVNIWLTALAIGSATTLMAGIGMKLGNALGNVAGKRAEIAGGCVLIGIGALILVEHLNLLA